MRLRAHQQSRYTPSALNHVKTCMLGAVDKDRSFISCKPHPEVSWVRSPCPLGFIEGQAQVSQLKNDGARTSKRVSSFTRPAIHTLTPQELPVALTRCCQICDKEA